MAHSPRAVKLVGQKGKNVRRKFYALLFLGGPEIGGVGKEVQGRVWTSDCRDFCTFSGRFSPGRGDKFPITHQTFQPQFQTLGNGYRAIQCNCCSRGGRHPSPLYLSPWDRSGRQSETASKGYGGYLGPRPKSSWAFWAISRKAMKLPIEIKHPALLPDGWGSKNG